MVKHSSTVKVIGVTLSCVLGVALVNACDMLDNPETFTTTSKNVQSKSKQPEVSQAPSTQPETSQPEVSQAPSTQPETSQPEVSEAPSTQPESSQPSTINAA